LNSIDGGGEHIFFLWHFDTIPGHGLPLPDFATTLIGQNTLGKTPLDE